MWNYSYIIPSIFILLIFLIYYFLRPRLPIRMNYTFVALLVVDLITVLSDYISSRADEAYTQHSIATLYVVNMLFFVFFFLRIYFFARFTIDVINSTYGIPKWIPRVAPLLCAAAVLISLSSPVTHAIFFIDGEGYHSGNMYGLLYFCFLFYIAAALAMILRRVGELPAKAIIPLVAYQCILLTGSIIRVMMPHILIMDTFCLMAIIIIYLSFENPDHFLSDRGTAFNQEALQVLLKEWNGKRNYGVLSFVIHNYNEHRGICGGEEMDQIIGQINKHITEQYPQVWLFSLDKGRFAIVGSDRVRFEKMREEIAQRFKSPWKTGSNSRILDVAFVQVGSEIAAYSADRIISILLLALDNAEKERVFSGGDRTLEPVLKIDDQLEARQALETALENDAVEVYLQPIIESRTGRIIAAEALARIRDKENRLILPDRFVPVAERDGQIGLLGEQVFRKVCSMIRSRDLSSAGISWINVNLSPHQFANEDMAQRLSGILAEYGVSADQVHLEITEQTLVDYPLLQRQIETLQEHGFMFVLDDYGSGYSNLIRIRQYPFQNIKIDMEVVWDYCRKPFPILPAFIASVKEMGMSITAEGIEDASMAEIMTEIGCDYLQGYHYSKPVPIADFFKSLQDDLS